MSAFMISPEHVCCLVTALYQLETLPGERPSGAAHGTAADRAKLRAHCLARACAISVDAHYSESAAAGLVEMYTYRAAPWPTDGHRDPKVLAKVLRLCHCYEYQANQHPSWEDSEAAAIIADIERRASRRLAAALAGGTWSTESASVFVRA